MCANAESSEVSEYPASRIARLTPYSPEFTAALCVCERERERERERRERKRESVCACVCVREREKERGYV